jgi:hypothetical protein
MVHQFIAKIVNAKDSALVLAKGKGVSNGRTSIL